MGEKGNGKMNVRKAQNLDKLAIVLSMAVITLALMAQTIYASGAAQADGEPTLLTRTPQTGH